MHSCFSDTPLAAGASVTLSPTESAHAARVLRMRAGDAVLLLDGEGLYEGALTRVDERATEALVARALPSPEARVKITLFQGLPKADKMETIVQKATELGAWSVRPVVTARCVAGAERGGKRERWARIALEAAKQSRRARVPEVTESQPFAALLPQLAGFDAALVAWEDARGLSVTRAVRQAEERCAAAGRPLTTLAFVVGPEGGLTEGEVAALNAAGCESVTLGPRILRTETAGLCCVVAALSALGEM